MLVALADGVNEIQLKDDRIGAELDKMVTSLAVMHLATLCMYATGKTDPTDMHVEYGDQRT
jgi:hypothetical protein